MTKRQKRYTVRITRRSFSAKIEFITSNNRNFSSITLDMENMDVMSSYSDIGWEPVVSKLISTAMPDIKEKAMQMSRLPVGTTLTEIVELTV